MAINIELPGYWLESQVSKDNFLTHYNAVSDSGSKCIITEFFPSYMVNRTESGNLEVVPRFANEYAIALEKYVGMATTMKTMNEASISPVESVIEHNGTAYVVRGINDLPTLNTFMGGRRMDTGEAFLFIRSLFLYLAQAERSFLMYKFSDQNLRVNRYGQLVLDSMFEWDTNYQTTITDLTKMYFQLITGSSYDPVRPNVEDYGIKLPPRLDTMLKEVLSGDILYGSIDDYYKKFKSLVDIDTGSESDGSGSNAASPALKWAAIGLSAVFTLALCLLLNLFLLPTYRNLYPGLANPNLLYPEQSMVPPEERTSDFFALAYTNPRDGGDILNGSFAMYGDILYTRGYDNGFHLMERKSNGAERVLVHNVRPSFITVSDNYVYFCDSLSNNKIYRVGKEGGQPELLSSNAALYLLLDGNYLYYTNHSDLDRLYRIDLQTKADSLVLMSATYESVTDGSHLFFTNGDSNFALSSVALSGGEWRVTQLNRTNSGNVKLHNGMLFFLEGETIKMAALNGTPIVFDCPIPTYAFHPVGDWLVIIDAHAHDLYAYNLNTTELKELSPGLHAAYVWAYGNKAYVVDLRNSQVTREHDIK